MQRSGWFMSVVAAAGVTTSIVLYLQKRALEDQLVARAGAAPAVTARDPWAAPAGSAETPAATPWTRPRAPIAVPRGGLAGKPPELAAAKDESRLERRLRRRAELVALLGRSDGETTEDYRARIVPLITTGLARPRAEVEDLRKQIEAKAGVTPEQHAKLDAAFDAVYDDLLKYTNGAIADGDLTPYRSNVAGMLEYAGGLGAILEGANGKIGQILSPDQQHAIDGSGFEWAEYLGTLAPWEKLDPPPPSH